MLFTPQTDTDQSGRAQGTSFSVSIYIHINASKVEFGKVADTGGISFIRRLQSRFTTIQGNDEDGI